MSTRLNSSGKQAESVGFGASAQCDSKARHFSVRADSCFFRQERRAMESGNSDLRGHFNSIPTGQWSLPAISGRMNARLSRGRNAALRRK